MVTTNKLQRTFRHCQKSIDLPDPNPAFTVAQVKDFYSNTYPELINANISGPELIDDKAQYSFTTVIGTKG